MRTLGRQAFAAAMAAAMTAVLLATPPSADRRAPLAADLQLPQRLLDDACDSRIVLLGESPTHGFGVAMQLKAQLVRALVKRCHVDAVSFESGIYDFLKIDSDIHAGRPVTAATLMAAVGLLWNNDDVAPLISFLADRANQRHLLLGGLDNQIARGTYAQHSMAADLVRPLDGEERTACLATLSKHLEWQYTDAAPYSPGDRARVLDCLDRIRSKSRVAGTMVVAMADNMADRLARDFPADPGASGAAEGFSARDASMFRNFQSLMARLPARSKVVVWTATVHAARDMSPVPGRENWRSLGSLLAREYGDQLFSLGISAYGGTYTPIGQAPATLPEPPAGSLEAGALGHTRDDLRYLAKPDLAALGAVASRLTGTSFVTAPWGRLFDGVLVVREERPPARSAPEALAK